MSKRILHCLLVSAVITGGHVASADDLPGNRRPGAGRQNSPQRGPRDMSAMFKRFDRNNDGVLEAREMPPQMQRRMGQMDANKDGKLTLEEMQQARGAMRRGGSAGRQGEVITGAAKGERHADSLKVGDPAPDFTLPDAGGKNSVTLSSFQGKKPVVLIFGSYT